MPLTISARTASRAAYVAAVLNFAASAAMLTVLRPGLPVKGSVLADRLAFVSGQPALWWGGWLLWHAAAISLLGFYVGLAGHWNQRAPLLTVLALLCATSGMAADLAAESLYMGIAPRLPPDAFSRAEDMAGMLTGYLGNGLYTVAGILLTWAGAKELPRCLLALAAMVWAAGLWLSAATLVHSARGQFWSTAILMPLFVLWTLLVGRWLANRR